ncbi:RrF2 family transcriptional regulator [Tautonia sociabilis]|uniref:Rrf2 family transcriptional regulator n=1 Tax=Tautonia sociabilis TaxID=2080755 RepID=A0A432MRU6_9BACT|nr:Rrf2 family transcriptional regulator [Tautonia sociabilis]RUL89686.1 Rrf2 family transcriptional regulator [Tautonia sociabilis]
MKRSAKAEYACLAMLALARHRPEEPPMRIREISEAQGIPERYLVQILLYLKGAGLVSSVRGASGGYRLTRPPDRISIAEVLMAIDGPEEHPREPQNPEARALTSVWEEVRRAEQAVLDRISLADLTERAAPRDWVI